MSSFYNQILSFNSKPYTQKSKIKEQKQKVKVLHKALIKKKKRYYKAIKYNPLEYYSNEVVKVHKRNNDIHYRTRLIPGDFNSGTCKILYLENHESELNLSIANIEKVKWCNNCCVIKFKNDSNTYFVKSEKTVFIKEYYNYMIENNLELTHWHRKLIDSSVKDTFYENFESGNYKYYYMNWKLLSHSYSDRRCPNAYYYFSYDKYAKYRPDKCGHPLSLQYQCATTIIRNFNNIDTTQINTRGVRFVSKQLYFKINHWCNMTLESILLHKLYMKNKNYDAEDKLMWVCQPYCKCRQTLTNGKCLEKGKCLICLGLQCILKTKKFERMICFCKD